jgi:colicin import membrane protein
MDQEDFDKLIAGAKMQLNAKIEAGKQAELERIERERKENLLRQRKDEVMHLADFIEWSVLTLDLSEENYQSIKQSGEKAKAEYLAEQERIRKENERLQKEAEDREKKIQAERKAAEEKAKKEREAAEAKLKAERDAREKAEREIKARAEADAKAKKAAEEKEAAEAKAREAAKKKAKAAPDKAKLIAFAETIEHLQVPEMSTDEGKKVLSDSRELIAKLSKFIRGQAGWL